MAEPRFHRPGTFWLLDQPLLLASASVTRLDMLKRSGLPVDVQPAHVDERSIEAETATTGLGKTATAAVLARAKALTVSRQSPARLVLGGDQTLQRRDVAYHKPANREAAYRQLSELSGCEHVLTSAFCLAQNGQVMAEGTDVARMFMRPLSSASLDRYLGAAGAAALGSVGCYQLEGLGSQLFDRIEGDHFTILGLPLLKVLAALRQLGAVSE